MPGGFQLGYGAANYRTIGADESTTSGTTLTASSSANTKGSFSQLVASTTYDMNGFVIYFGGLSFSGASFLYDIAVGAAASEIVILPNIVFDTPSTSGAAYWIETYVPLSIPAGTRISGRIQSTQTGGQTAKTYLQAVSGAFDTLPACGFATNYGANTSTSLGVAVDPGGSANTKGSWIEITSSTTYDVIALQCGFDGRGSADTTNTNWYVDIGIGASGSEVVILPDILVGAASSASLMANHLAPVFFCQIPAGTRIAARAQCQTTTLARRVIGVSLIGYS